MTDGCQSIPAFSTTLTDVTLEVALRAADTTRARLLDALLADALNPASMQEMKAAE